MRKFLLCIMACLFLPTLNALGSNTKNISTKTSDFKFYEIEMLKIYQSLSNQTLTKQIVLDAVESIRNENLDDKIKTISYFVKTSHKILKPIYRIMVKPLLSEKLI